MRLSARRGLGTPVGQGDEAPAFQLIRSVSMGSSFAARRAGT
jgi:hypothetical protein